jgi:hypothetical protein
LRCSHGTAQAGDFEGQGIALEAACSCGHKRIIPGFLLRLYGPEARLYPFALELLGANRVVAATAPQPLAALLLGTIVPSNQFRSPPVSAQLEPAVRHYHNKPSAA